MTSETIQKMANNLQKDREYKKEREGESETENTLAFAIYKTNFT